MSQSNSLIFKYYYLKKSNYQFMHQVKKLLLFKFLYCNLKGNEHKVWHNKVKPKFAGSYLYMLKTQILILF